MTDQRFHVVNRLLFYHLKMKGIRYYLPTIEIKRGKVKIDGRIVFDQTVENNLKAYNNIRKYRTVQGDDCTTGCLLVYWMFIPILKNAIN